VSDLKTPFRQRVSFKVWMFGVRFVNFLQEFFIVRIWENRFFGKQRKYSTFAIQQRDAIKIIGIQNVRDLEKKK
jgi:hypothetical protein